MDETRIKAPSISSGTPARFFPPHRRRPLKSQTYNTLLLIFSQCSDESFASQNLETDLSTDNGSNELQQRTKEQESQPIELVNSMDPTSSVFEKATELNSSGGDDKSSKDITIGEQMSINQIEQLMGLEEEVEDSSNREEFFSEQMIINELVHIVQGDEGDSPENNPKPFQQIEISGKACQTIPCPDNITINESKNQETVEPISVLLFEHEDRRLPESNASMDVDIGKPTEVVEEGEISFYGNSEDVVSMDFLMQDKKADEEFITDENQLARESESSFFSADKAEKTENSGTVKESVVDPVLEDRNVKKEGNERSNSPVVYDNIWDDIIPAEQEQDVAHCPKRKRGPITKEKRAKRKAKDRKKRAEKNRQLGVRRVKLPPMPIPKPKPLQYCRHFLHGRCQEGDKCKFSHDTVPLTKSKACCHFARHSCMKGDDCPFDHQLSKYPCTNFASNGFCGRGEDCLFSHKTLSEENSSKSTEVEKKLASLIADATSKKQQNNVAGNAEKSRNGSASKQLQSVAAKVTHSPLSVERPKEQHISSQNGNFNAKSGTHFDEPRPGAVLPSPPAVTPKGVSFISIRRSQLDDKSGSGNFNPKAGTHFDQPRSNTGLPNPLNVTPKGVHVISVGRGQPALESSRNTGQSSPAPASYPTPKGINFFSFGNNLTKTPTSQIIPSKLSDSAPKGINILTRGRKTVHNSSDKGKTLTSDRENGKSAVSPAILSPFPISLIQSSSESSTRKDTPPSAHKSLLSALALASKYESRKEDPKEDNLSQVS